MGDVGLTTFSALAVMSLLSIEIGATNLSDLLKIKIVR
jgi:hypothetical protein